MFRVAAGDDSGFVITAQLTAFGSALAGIEEGCHLLGDADFRVAAEFFEDGRGFVEQAAVRGEERLERAGE